MLYFGLALLAVIVGFALFWYIQTRNVEIARYQVIETDGAMEIRDYPPLTAAEVTRSGSRDTAVRSAFGSLAGYIFAKDRSGEKIAMTAPVTQTMSGDTWTVRFIMPSSYSLDRLPKPSGADVRLVELPAARRAAIRFSGWWSDALFEEKNAALLAWMAAKGLEAEGTPTLAYYNDPFTPGFLRRNEVLYDVKQ